jgi:8-oxo-dGTP diphosphatase
MNLVVVAAVIEEAGSFLLTRRPADKHLAGLWEFPGGKTNKDEPHAEALRREIREELDADVSVMDLILHTTHEYPDRAVALYFYTCRLIGAPRALLGQQMRWVPREELPLLPFPPADTELISLLTSSAER